jgi:hypothetical protein
MTDLPKKPSDHMMEQYDALKPLAKVLGIFNKDIRESVKKMDESAADFRKFQAATKVFIDDYSDLGWTLCDSISTTHIIAAVESESIDDGETALTNYFLAETELEHAGYKFHRETYRIWMPLYERAKERLLADDFISAVPLLFMIIDGICLKYFQRHPFSGAAEKDVFDSFTSGPDALEKAYALLGQTRRKINDDEIPIPFRHGILHGVDTNYGHRIVAAKAVNILRATIDYVEASLSETARIEDAVKEQTPPKWKDISETIQRTQSLKKATADWTPREDVVAETLAVYGTPHDFDNNSPEAMAADYLDAIISKNYGFLGSAGVFWTEGSPGKRAGEMRDQFAELEITGWTITGYTDTASAATNVTANVTGIRLGQAIDGEIIIRCIYQAIEDQKPLTRGMEGGRWYVMPNVHSAMWQIKT